MPAIFFGHGNPMNALLENSYTKHWAAIGAAIPKPKAILAVSAHWYIQNAAVTIFAPFHGRSMISADFRESYTRCDIPRRVILIWPLASKKCWLPCQQGATESGDSIMARGRSYTMSIRTPMFP
jgi:hypothetical protein